VQNLKSEIKALEIQRDTVYALQNNRTQAVELAEMFTRRVPEEVYLTEVNQVEQSFTVKGIANSNERVSQVLRNLQQVEWIKNVQLLQTKALKMEETLPNSGVKTERTFFDFSLSFNRVLPNISKPNGNGSINNNLSAPEKSPQTPV
jgi:type IV pilus assembly protein PilN